MHPLLWKGEHEEANPEIHRLARLFAGENLSETPDFRSFMRTWLLTEVNGDALVQPWGIMSLRMAVDCPLFHMRVPERNREAFEKFAKGYRMLARRGREYLQDQGWGGQQIFIHVSEDSQNATMVKRLFNELGLHESYRLAMEV